MSDTLDELQAHIAHQQKQIDELSEVVARQDAEIAKLNKTLEILFRQVRDQVDTMQKAGMPVDERPPHY